MRCAMHGRGIGAERARRGGAHNHRERRDDLVRRRPGAPARACSGVRRSRTAHAVRHRAQRQHGNACGRTPGLCAAAANQGLVPRQRAEARSGEGKRELCPRARAKRYRGRAWRRNARDVPGMPRVPCSHAPARRMLHVFCCVCCAIYAARCMLDGVCCICCTLYVAGAFGEAARVRDQRR